MKKLLLVCCMIIGVSAVSLAQGGGGRPPQKTPEETLAGLKTSLTLTDAQSAKLLPILTAQKKSTDSLVAAANGDFQSMMPVMTAMRTKYTAQINAVLTPDQQAAYAKLMPARRGGGGGGGMGGGGGTPPPPQR
jgi:periplasmic protein CpxP/Spy